jgi:hypothetical protein
MHQEIPASIDTKRWDAFATKTIRSAAHMNTPLLHLHPSIHEDQF